MTPEWIHSRSPQLPTVKELGKANSETLGFLPEGAFDDYAKKRQIIVALDLEHNCIGYLLYRMNRRQQNATIVHLCVAAEHRHKGIARKLIKALRDQTTHLRGITALCRRDYRLGDMWKDLGFVARGEKAGRGRDRTPLTVWWLDHGQPDLFTQVDDAGIETTVAATLDANVFYDLQDPETDATVESKALEAPWLTEHLALLVTPELLNEINSHPAPKERERRRVFAYQFKTVNASQHKMEVERARLRRFFEEPLSSQDEGDLRHLAWTVAGELQFFITRDGTLLEMEEAMYQECGVHIIRPCDIITHLDSMLGEVEYRPTGLAGTAITWRLAKAKEGEVLAALFLNSAEGERKASLERTLREVLARPRDHEVRVIETDEAEVVALLVCDRSRPEVLHVPLIRVRRDWLAGTMARHVVFKGVEMSSAEGRTFTRITDKYAGPEIRGSLVENGFSWSKDRWEKTSLCAVETGAGLAARLRSLSKRWGARTEQLLNMAEVLDGALANNDREKLLDIERHLWPAKIADADIPAFIVPIEPKWAERLFDEQLAKQTLFPTEAELIMSYENAYYRAKAWSGGITAPARILWYVSEEGTRDGAKHLRACSRLDEVVIGTPKELFKRFRRLGVYEFKDLVRTAHGDCEGEIMAFRFSATELFSLPIPWDEVKRMRGEEENKSSPIMSPTRITNELFLRLYSKGREIELSGDGDGR